MQFTGKKGKKDVKFLIGAYLLCLLFLILFRKEMMTRNLFGRKYLLDLDKYDLRLWANINVDTNQAVSRKLEIIDRSTENVVGYIFENLADDALFKILEYYNLDTSIFDKRSVLALPLSKNHRSSKYTYFILGILLPSFLLLVGAYVSLIETNQVISGLICLALGIAGITYGIYNIVKTSRGKDEG